ncbi:altronate dehydratase family protein [Bacteroides sp. OttesenSCG-928-D19]|nr:altronate dehydratase family protein [Bacteroides sp. OttesenSCG-928-D19]
MRYIQINPADNVAVAIQPLHTGEKLSIGGKEVEVKEEIPAGHKIALRDFSLNEHIIKYGDPIGHAISAIACGTLVNEKNIKTNLEGLSEYTYSPVQIPPQPEKKALTFKGYRRKNGEVGIRNEVWIIPTVGCVNGIVGQLADTLKAETGILVNNGDSFGAAGVDAIVAYPHNYGCSQLGDDHENTRKILRDMVKHPNVGAVLIVGLGCENNQPAAFREFLGDYDEERVRFMVTQEVDDEYEEGMRILRELYDIASSDKREEIPFGELKVGLKCGGSDGFSGITANPLLGVFSDFLVAQGGCTVLTEVPEMFGAETILMNRCDSEGLFDETVSLINDFKNYFISNHQPVYENPSPGNKAGGISTLEEKSLGCTQKSGSSAVKDVLRYGDRIRKKGLSLLSAPGNDLVASTALASAGCHIVLFTTGRGTPFGTFVPTAKISTNTRLSEHKPGWIDFNAGTLVEGESMQSLADRFIEFVRETASGKKVNTEKKNYREIAIFKTGITL